MIHTIFDILRAYMFYVIGFIGAIYTLLIISTLFAIHKLTTFTMIIILPIIGRVHRINIANRINIIFQVINPHLLDQDNLGASVQNSLRDPPNTTCVCSLLFVSPFSSGSNNGSRHRRRKEVRNESPQGTGGTGAIL